MIPTCTVYDDPSDVLQIFSLSFASGSSSPRAAGVLPLVYRVLGQRQRIALGVGTRVGAPKQGRWGFAVSTRDGPRFIRDEMAGSGRSSMQSPEPRRWSPQPTPCSAAGSGGKTRWSGRSSCFGAASETAMTAEGGRAGLAPPLMMVVLPRFEAASVTTPDHPRRLLFYHDKATTCDACRASAMADESPGCFEVNDEKATVASDPHIRPWKALGFPAG